MRRTILAVVLTAGLVVPAAVQAQQSAPSQSGEILGLTKEQALTIGAGVIVGALVIHVVVPGDLAYFAGGVAGGLVANWWYHHGGEGQVRAVLKQPIDDAAKPDADRALLEIVALKE